MNTMEKMLYLSSQFMMLSVDKERNAQELDKISKELTALQREARPEVDSGEQSNAQKTTVVYGFVKFTQKEISQMPTKFRKVFRLAGCLVQA